MSKEVKVEAEGRELVLRNSAGDYAIIPKNRRAEVMKMLEDKCYGCIDSVVASLPKTSNEGEKEASKKVEYAQEGLEVEEEEISEEGSFGEAFAKARREKGAGQTFEWRGGTYSTNYAIEPEEAQREAIEPVEVTAEAETITSSIPVPEEEADTTLSTLELQPLDTSSPEVEEERSNRRPYTGNVDVDKVTAREQREFMEEFFPRDEEGNIVEEDPILDEFSEVDEAGDERSFSEAFREARKRLGAGQTFEWRGGKYTTDYAEEVGGAGIEFSDEEDTLVEEEGEVEVEVEGASAEEVGGAGIEFSDEEDTLVEEEEEFEVGVEVFMYDEEGNLTIPTDGEYEYEDKTLVVEGGIVTEIKETEPQPEEVEAEEEEEEVSIEEDELYPTELAIREFREMISEGLGRPPLGTEIEDESAEEGASVEEVEGNEEFIEKWGGARYAGPGRRVIPLERQRDEAIKEGRQAIIPELYRRSLIKGVEAIGYDMEDEETRKIVEGLLKKYEEQGVSGVEYQKELRKLLYKNPKAIRTALRQ